MAKHVVSTLSADTRYTKWVHNNGVNTVERFVLVRGGAGVATKGRGDPTTPEGVITHITDDDAKFLSEHNQFKEHQSKGFVKIINIARDADTVAQSMSKDDGSRPKTPDDVKEYSKKKGGKEEGTSLQAVTNDQAA